MKDWTAMESPGGHSESRLLLRPSPRAPRVRRQLTEGAALGLVVIVALGALELVAGSMMGWVLIGLCALWYGLLPWLYFRNASLYVGDGRVAATNLFGHRRHVEASRVAVVRVAQTGRRTRKIVFENASGAPLLAVYATAWRTSQLDDLRRAIGLTER